MADNSMIAVARPDPLSLGDVKLEDKQSVPAENKLAELEAMIVTQVEFYFSAENLPQDQFLLGQLKIGGDNKVALKVVTKFNKMRKLLMKLAKLTGSEGMNSTNSLHRVLAAASSPHLSLSDDGEFTRHLRLRIRHQWVKSSSLIVKIFYFQHFSLWGQELGLEARRQRLRYRATMNDFAQ